jgi:hypothetical protein
MYEFFLLILKILKIISGIVFYGMNVNKHNVKLLFKQNINHGTKKIF